MTSGSDQPSTPHDALFKRAFSDPDNAAGLLQAILPPAVVARIDWATLRSQPTNFVDDRLAQRRADLLFSVELDGRQAFLYLLLEHQSDPETLMPFRMLRYSVRIWDEWLRGKQNVKRIPVVVPIVVHHSEHGWTAPTELSELYDIDPELLAALGPHVPQLRILLDDLSAVDDAALRKRARQAFALLTLRLLAHGRISTPEQLLAKLRSWTEAFGQLVSPPSGMAALAALVEYTLRVSQLSTDELRAFLLELGPAGDEAFMTGAQQLIEQGRAEGRAEGRADVLLILLAEKFGTLDQAVVERIRSADVETLDRYAKRLVSVSTLDEVLS